MCSGLYYVRTYSIYVPQESHGRSDLSLVEVTTERSQTQFSIVLKQHNLHLFTGVVHKQLK